MSYSFTVRAATKLEAKAKVAAELSNVLNLQPTHVVDIAAAQAAAYAFIDLVGDDETKDLQVAVNGSVGWVHRSEPVIYTQASVGVNAWLVAKDIA
jgi:hypothetical protein